MPFFLRTLGKGQLERAGEPVLTSPQLLLVLAYLVRRGGVRRRDLADLLWTHVPLAEERLAKLSECLRRLGKVAPDLVQEAGRVLTTPVASDVAVLQEAIDAEDYELALSLYGGAFLRGYESNGKLNLSDRGDIYTWLLGERDAFAAQVWDATLALAERYVAQENYDEALKLVWRVWREAKEDYGFTPHEYRRLFVLFTACGSRLAQEVAHAAHKVWEEEADINPALHRGEAQAQLATPHNLPEPTDGFIGRQEELEPYRDLLRLGRARLLTLLGLAGVGKTRLALELTRSLRGYKRFEDGVYVVWLETLTTIPEAIGAIAVTLDLKLTQDGSARTLARALGHKSLLLFLDNAEHLPDLAEVLERLLEGCPNLTLLVTSRVRLPVPGEHVLALEGLPYPPETHDAPATYEAVQLFMRRAGELQPDFPQDDSTLQRVAALCRQVEGNPLALLLAASWVRHSPLETIQAELERDLGILEDGRGKGRSMTAALDFSWRLLRPDAQAAYCDLSVFEGSFFPEAALEVSRTPLPLLREFGDASLLRYSEGRYSFHPLLLAFARAKAQVGGVTGRLQEAHSRYYLEQLRLMTHGTQEEKNGAPQRLLPDFANIQKAWRTAVAQADVPEILESTRALWRFCEVTASIHQGIHLLEQAEACAQTPTLRGGLRAAQAWLSYSLGHYHQTRSLAQEALTLAQEAGLAWAESLALNALGASCDMLGFFEEALMHFSSVLQAAPPDSDEEASALINLGIVKRRTGDYASAQQQLERAASLFERSRKFAKVVQARYGCILTLLETAQYPEARASLEQAQSLAQTYSVLYWQPRLKLLEAQLALAEEKPRQAQTLAAEVWQQAQALAQTTLAGKAQALLARSALAQGDCETALGLAQNSLERFSTLHDLPYALSVQLTLAEIQLQGGYVPTAAFYELEQQQNRMTAADQQRLQRLLNYSH